MLSRAERIARRTAREARRTAREERRRLRLVRRNARAARVAATSRVVVLPYKMGSKSAKDLSASLSQRLGVRVRRVRTDGTYRPRTNSIVVNYGSGVRPPWLTGVNTLNKPEAVAVSSNKLRAFNLFKQHGVSTPEWTSLRQEAEQWRQGGAVVVCRTLLNGHSGRGIILASGDVPLVAAPLYVKYKKKLKEFRVHVFKGQVIDVSEKRKRLTNVQDRFDGQIRNLANGWVFCRDGLVCPADLHSCAIAACSSLGLDFGAVDIIYNGKDNKCYVLEVNTAPGLTGTTLEKYVAAVEGWVRQQ